MRRFGVIVDKSSEEERRADCGLRKRRHAGTKGRPKVLKIGAQSAAPGCLVTGRVEQEGRSVLFHFGSLPVWQVVESRRSRDPAALDVEH